MKWLMWALHKQELLSGALHFFWGFYAQEFEAVTENLACSFGE